MERALNVGGGPALPFSLRLARALAGVGADPASATPPASWSGSGSIALSVAHAVWDGSAGSRAAAGRTLDTVARPFVARPLLVIAAALLLVPVERLLLPADVAASVGALLLGVAGLAAVLAFARALDTGGDGRIVVRLLLLGFLVRAACLALLTVRGPFPDEVGIYHVLAEHAATAWSLGGTSELAVHPVVIHRAAYFYLLSGAYLTWGGTLLVGRVLGALIGLLVAVMAGEVARPLAGRRAALIAVGLVALHPEHALWSVTLSRDSLTALLVLTALALLLRRPGRLLGVGGALVAVPLLLLAMNSFLLCGALAATLGLIAVGEAVVRARRSTAGWAVLALVLVAAGGAVAYLGHTWGPYFTPRMIGIVRTQAIGGPGGFLPGAEVTSWLGLAAILPLGAGFVLFAPFPWDAGDAATGFRAAYGAVALLGHAVTLLGLLGLSTALRRRAAAAAPPVLFAVIALTALALLEGNAGIVVRHRLPLTAVLSVGAAVWLAGMRGTSAPRAP